MGEVRGERYAPVRPAAATLQRGYARRRGSTAFSLCHLEPKVAVHLGCSSDQLLDPRSAGCSVMQNLKYGYLASSFGGFVVSCGQLPVRVPCQGATKKIPSTPTGTASNRITKNTIWGGKRFYIFPLFCSSWIISRSSARARGGICLVDGDPLPQRCVMILGVKLVAVAPVHQRRVKEAHMSIFLFLTGQQQGTKRFAGCQADENRSSDLCGGFECFHPNEIW